MTYHVEKAIDSIGKDKVLYEIFYEGITLIELHQFLKLSTSNKRLGSEIYKRIYKYLGITELPYKKLGRLDRKFKLATDRAMPNYWEDAWLVYELFRRIESPTINIAEDRFRAVINFKAHPKANKDSGQLKAHIVAWELYNKKYVPDNHWVVPLDGNYLNMEEGNLILVNTTEYKSNKFKDKGNPSYLHGNYAKPRLGGWSVISKAKIAKDKCCQICDNTDMLVVHHIISYHLFEKPMEANQELNLITLCRHCHGKIHGHSLSIKQVLISEMRYSKLIELLENLKSQVPDTLMETYKDVEKQLGLTDNQQPSTV